MSALLSLTHFTTYLPLFWSAYRRLGWAQFTEEATVEDPQLRQYSIGLARFTKDY